MIKKILSLFKFVKYLCWHLPFKLSPIFIDRKIESWSLRLFLIYLSYYYYYFYEYIFAITEVKHLCMH